MRSPRDLFSKIEWEGGIGGAIRYGIKADRVPIEIAGLWADAEDLVAELEAIERDIEYELDRLLEEADAEDEDTDL